MREPTQAGPTQPDGIALFGRSLSIYLDASAAYRFACSLRPVSTRARGQVVNVKDRRASDQSSLSDSGQARVRGHYSPPPSELTPRQREVAALIALGFTNAQIADQLVVTEGTAANHVAQILGRLGLDRRTQIAAWAIQHGVSADIQATAAD